MSPNVLKLVMIGYPSPILWVETERSFPALNSRENYWKEFQKSSWERRIFFSLSQSHLDEENLERAMWITLAGCQKKILLFS